MMFLYGEPGWAELVAKKFSVYRLSTTRNSTNLVAASKLLAVSDVIEMTQSRLSMRPR